MPGCIGLAPLRRSIVICQSATSMRPQGMEERDGYPVDTNCLFMTDGASPSVHRTIELLTRNSDDAFLTPIPQYPLCVFPHRNSRASAAPAHGVSPQAQAQTMVQVCRPLGCVCTVA